MPAPSAARTPVRSAGVTLGTWYTERMSAAAAGPVRLDFNDFVLYTKTHPGDAFELIDGAVYTLAPEGERHFRTRSAIALALSQALELTKFTPYSEGSFPAPGWADGPRPDVFVARGPWMIDGRIAERPTAREIALVIEVASSSRPKDRRRAERYARPDIPECWLIDPVGATVVAYSLPTAWLRGRPHAVARSDARVERGRRPPAVGRFFTATRDALEAARGAVAAARSLRGAMFAYSFDLERRDECRA